MEGAAAAGVAAVGGEGDVEESGGWMGSSDSVAAAIRKVEAGWNLCQFASASCRTIVFYDLETTIPPTDIIEFGAVVLDRESFSEIEDFETLVHSKKVTPRSKKANGISSEHLVDAPTFEEVAPRIFEILDQQVWAGHNVNNFDNKVLVRAFLAHGLTPPAPVCVVDTLPLLRRAVGTRAGDMKLASLGRMYGLGEEEHRALSDARMNVEVFKRAAMTALLESSSVPVKRAASAPRPAPKKQQTPSPRTKRPPGEPDADPETVAALEAARTAGQTVWVAYDGGKAPLSPRPIAPLEWIRPASLLLARCLNTNSNRHFNAYKVKAIWPEKPDGNTLEEPDGNTLEESQRDSQLENVQPDNASTASEATDAMPHEKQNKAEEKS
jgi:DNA polymerase III epsilon subunit-like protein